MDNRSDIDKNIKRLTRARTKMLVQHPFYGMLLMHMKFVLSDAHETAWSDMMETIYLNPTFLENISDDEILYVLQHVLLHVLLGHFNDKISFERDIYDKSMDLVVNSKIYTGNKNDSSTITLDNYGGVQRCYVFNYRKPGNLYTVDEVFNIIKKNILLDKTDNARHIISQIINKKGWDYHPDESELENNGYDKTFKKKWRTWFKQAAEACKNDHNNGYGDIPADLLRDITEEEEDKIEWRILLNEFIQEEINDYSFCPPDRRFGGSDFFLPDFNEKDDTVKRILFMIDTSGSMSDEEISECYNEIKSAINLFDGKLSGWLGFFDARVVEPMEFSDVDEFKTIRPIGGGGTKFEIIFDYVKDEWQDNEQPQSIIILTDGYAPFPDVKKTMGIPVLWLINNNDVTPPWGKVARIL